MHQILRQKIVYSFCPFSCAVSTNPPSDLCLFQPSSRPLESLLPLNRPLNWSTELSLFPWPLPTINTFYTREICQSIYIAFIWNQADSESKIFRLFSVLCLLNNQRSSSIVQYDPFPTFPSPSLFPFTLHCSFDLPLLSLFSSRCFDGPFNQISISSSSFFPFRCRSYASHY